MKNFLGRLRHLMTMAYHQYKKLRLLRYVLRPHERILLIALALSVIVSGVFFTIRIAGLEFVRVPKAGGSYTEAIVGSPALLNPLFALANPTDSDLTRLIYAGIVRKDADGNIVPDLAERFTVSTDQKTYTIRLRQNAMWHDGKRVSADDVLFTIERIQNPETRSPLAQSFRGVVATKVDDATVQLTLKEAFAPFIETLTTGVLPAHLWRDVPTATASLAEYNFKPVGAGPFRFDTFVKDKKGNIKSYTLERFGAYHGITSYLKKITFKFYPTFDDTRGALAEGDVEGIHFIPKRLKEKLGAGPYQLQQLTFPQYTALFFNQQKNPALKDKRVRQALIASGDRERIIRDVLGGEATTITGPIPPGTLGAVNGVRAPTFDPKKADALLTAAGWKTITKEAYKKKRDLEQEKELQNQRITESKNHGITATAELRDVERDVKPTETKKDVAPSNDERLLDRYREKNGEILTIQLTTIDHPENVEVARIIAEGWEALGARVVTTIQKDNFQKDVVQPRAYDALLFGVISGRDPDPYPFWHSSQREAPGVNLALFANREADALLEDARRTNDLGIREAKYKRFQEILDDELPADFLYTPTYTYLIGNNLKGFAIKNIAKPDDRFANVAEWHVKTKWTLKKVEADARR